MPHLIIDDKAVDVPEGTTVIDAAELAGIMIPRFCYLKVLGSVGACRMCAVSFLAGPVKGIAMSCMVKAVDGMLIRLWLLMPFLPVNRGGSCKSTIKIPSPLAGEG